PGLVGGSGLAVGRQQVVVDLQYELAARGDRVAHLRLEERLGRTRRPRSDPAGAPVEVGETAPGGGGPDPGTAEACPAVARAGVVGRLRLGHVGRVDPVDDRMVHDVPVLWQELAAGEERRRRDVRIDEEATVLIGAAVWSLRGVRLGEVDRLEPLA